MRTVIVFNHPYSGSYCAAILNAVVTGLRKGKQEVDLMHLDHDRFNPVMTEQDLKAFVDRKPVDPQVIDYSRRLGRADHLVFIFPIWWELMPALTKGFIDRVIFPGVAYDHKEKGIGMKPLFPNLKGVTIITTMNQPRWFYALVFSNPIKKSMVTGTFWKMGYRNLKWVGLGSVKDVPAKKRKRWLDGLETRFSQLS